MLGELHGDLADNNRQRFCSHFVKPVPCIDFDLNAIKQHLVYCGERASFRKPFLFGQLNSTSNGCLT
jgi:hypothetical protein